MSTISATYESIHSEILADIEKLVGSIDFPLELTIGDNKLLAYSFETEWKTGTTEAIPHQVMLTDASGKTYTKTEYEYKENYIDQHLTDKQIKDIKTYLDKAKLKS